jgi:glycerol-1-phosphate dehydrogenase [NAD(P)+]
MNRHTLLGNSFNCQCGRQHDVPVRRFVYDPNAIAAIPGIIGECTETQPTAGVAVVADSRTWEVCGNKVFHSLSKRGPKCISIIVPDRPTGWPVCDERTCQWLKGQIQPESPAIIIAIGSGVINDLCKWASFELGVPYMVVATAASMNGYAAANVAAKVRGVKILIEARPPVAVVAEPAVIENAPGEMTAAGFADTIAKYQSNADWLMNNFLLGEYYCDYCANILVGLESSYLRRPQDIRQGKSDAIKGLFEALFWAGIAMTLVGTSAPASGGEHLLSHTLDMIANLGDEQNDLHGKQVGLGTILSAALYQKILQIREPQFANIPTDIDESFWHKPEVRTAVRQQYAAKRPRLQTMRSEISRPAVWRQLKDILSKATKSPQQIKSWLNQAGAATSIRELRPLGARWSPERVRAAAMHMHEIRSRCTVVDLAWVLGILPGAAAEIINEWLTD